MSVNVITNFNINTNAPIDSRIVASNSVVRNSIHWTYEGLKVYQIDNQKNYIWIGGTWSIEGGSGNGIYGGSGSLVGDTYINTGTVSGGVPSATSKSNILYYLATSGVNNNNLVRFANIFNRSLSGSDWTTIEVKSQYSYNTGYGWKDGPYISFNPSSGSGGIAFGTGDGVSYALSEKMRITPNGLVGINNVNPLYTLDVGGSINSVDSIYAQYLFNTFAPGSATVTNYSFDPTGSGDYTTGLYSIDGTDIGLSIGGQDIIHFYADNLSHPNPISILDPGVSYIFVGGSDLVVTKKGSGGGGISADFYTFNASIHGNPNKIFADLNGNMYFDVLNSNYLTIGSTNNNSVLSIGTYIMIGNRSGNIDIVTNGDSFDTIGWTSHILSNSELGLFLYSVDNDGYSFDFSPTIQGDWHLSGSKVILYKKIGKTVFVSFNVTNSTIALSSYSQGVYGSDATPVELYIKLPSSINPSTNYKNFYGKGLFESPIFSVRTTFGIVLGSNSDIGGGAPSGYYLIITPDSIGSFNTVGYLNLRGMITYEIN